MGNQVFAACKTGNTEEIRRLVTSGEIDVNTKINGATPLHWACQYKKLEAVEVLLELKADINAVSKGGNTPLHITAMENSYEIMLVLINSGANVSVKNDEGITPMHIVCQYSHIEAFKMLLSKGASVMVRDNQGNTPLHVACTMSKDIIFGPLLTLGADLMARTDDGSTPLHYACRHNRLRAMNFLMANGVDVNAQNNAKQTPLHDACGCGHIEAAHLLIACGADTTATDMNGKLPSQLSSFETARALNVVMTEWSARSAEFSAEIAEMVKFLKSFGIPTNTSSLVAHQIVITHKLNTLPKLQEICRSEPAKMKDTFRGMGIDDKTAGRLMSSLSGGACVIA